MKEAFLGNNLSHDGRRRNGQYFGFWSSQVAIRKVAESKITIEKRFTQTMTHVIRCQTRQMEGKVPLHPHPPEKVVNIRMASHSIAGLWVGSDTRHHVVLCTHSAAFSKMSSFDMDGNLHSTSVSELRAEPRHLRVVHRRGYKPAPSEHSHRR